MAVLAARPAPLEVRLAQDEAEILAAQHLRYRVFYEERGATATAEMAADKLDRDEFDPVCDHLLVIDHALPADEAVVGTYRLLREEVAIAHDGFYSASEYDLSPMFMGRDESTLRQHGQFLELGRSCVRAEYRSNATIQFLWKGIAEYVYAHRVSYLFGCASLPGTDVSEHAEALSYLYHNFRAPEELCVYAVPSRHIEMNIMPSDQIRERDVVKALPPLIKGYLRCGCYIGDGAVIDKQFCTTDVFILQSIARVPDKYFAHLARRERPL
ncbi:MAG: GNAT family N-acetyltransferase [Alphaproteobacteria bacterium]|nr:GNAT family N-acetyltransferase [Alphaproteobacteria bacterium]